MIPQEFPRVRDLFFDIGWKGEYPDVESEVFLPNLLPWQVLLTAWNALSSIVSTTPDILSFSPQTEKDLYSKEEWRVLQLERERDGVLSQRPEPERERRMYSAKAWQEIETRRSLSGGSDAVNGIKIGRSIPDLRVRRSDNFPFPYLRDSAKELEHNHPNLDERQTILRGGWNLSLDPSSRVQGPVYFGRDVQLRLSSSVSKSIIGSPAACDCQDCNQRLSNRGGLIGHTARVERSIFRSSVIVGNGASVGWSVVGSHVQIGTNTKLAQRRYKPGKTVKVKFIDSKGNKHKVDTHFEDFGFVAGDCCKIGVGVTIHHGVILMPYCKVPGGRTLKPGVYYPNSFQ